MIMILIKHDTSGAALSNCIALGTKDQSTTIQEPAVIDRNTSSSWLDVIFMAINRPSMILLLEAEESVVHPQFY